MVTRVLKSVDLNVYEGELLVILGESGCGKSTMHRF
ncbi:MAG: ATP-binding cassette domain-containing protein [Ruminococcus sp.]